MYRVRQSELNQIFRRDVMRWRMHQRTVTGTDSLLYGEPYGGGGSEEGGEMADL